VHDGTLLDTFTKFMYYEVNHSKKLWTNYDEKTASV